MPATPSRHLLTRAFGVLFLIAGVLLAAGGLRLVVLGGATYYLLAGVALALSGALLVARHPAGLWLYALLLAGSTLWSLYEVRLDFWQLVPRLGLWFALGLPLLLPWVWRPLGTRAARGLGAALGVTGLVALAALLNPPEAVEGRLSRDIALARDAQPAEGDGDWPAYGRSAYGDRYSPLTQITAGNVDQLELAWSYRTGDLPGPGDPQETTAENTPLKVNGLLYLCTPHSQVIALKPETGEEVWRFDPRLSTRDAKSFEGWAHMTCRGVAYHDEASYPELPPAPDNPCPRRLFLPTADTRLIALNADTGQRCADFGEDGAVDLSTGIGAFRPGGYYSTSPPAVTRERVIIGGHVTDNLSNDEPSGVIRAYDVKSGRLLWNWDSGNPERTEPLPAGETYTRNSPNMWSVMSVDENLGLVYLPMGNQTPDQWGGQRTEDSERFSASVVALEIATGRVRWHYQFVHHDLWDMDVGGQPTLIDLRTADGVRPALIASTKQGSLYVLDRSTGEPLVPIEERPVPQGAAAGDWTSPTQPYSALNFSPPDLRERDMWGATPFDQLLCRIRFRSLRYDGMFTPPSEQGSIVYPGNFGVFDWGGISVDPARQLVLANPSYMAFVSRLIPREAVEAGPARRSETEGVQPNRGTPFGVVLEPLLSPLGLPCQRPPWGYVAAVDLVDQRVIWMHRNGTVRDSSPLPLPFAMGVPSLGGMATTAGGVTFLSGTLDQYLRAYDVASGEERWRARLPAGGQTTPMTYLGEDGRQYVVVVAGGHGSLGTRQGDYVLAYRLPGS